MYIVNVFLRQGGHAGIDWPKEQESLECGILTGSDILNPEP